MKRLWLILLALLTPAAALAHVGSPDVYADGQAGPYHLSIVLRPPQVIPGVADVEVRAQTPGMESITIAPVPLTGEASKHPPVPDAMQKPSGDGQFYSGHLWIMETGSWQIRFAVSGSQGSGVLSIPLPATAITTGTMQRGMGAMLAALGALLIIGMVGIVGAAAREAKLAPGETAANYRAGRIAMTVTAALLLAAVVLGNSWWKSEAASYAGNTYKPLRMSATLQGGNLALKLQDPGWIRQRKLDDFIPDHDHLMHLYMIRWPQMDAVYHLHPDQTGIGEFTLQLPSMAAGDYRLYADVVHAMGFPETIVGNVQVPVVSGRALSGDDAAGTAAPVSAGSPSDPEQSFALPDGYRMVWKRPANLVTKTPENFQFELIDKTGKPASDVALYMGMPGHAAFVKTDGSVFAHIHPNGTMAMAAFMMANGKSPNHAGMNMGDMPGMQMGSAPLPATVSFPYGFPSAGRYRIFVQMKHGTTVETGVFDAIVSEEKRAG